MAASSLGRGEFRKPDRGKDAVGAQGPHTEHHLRVPDTHILHSVLGADPTDLCLHTI